STVVQPARAVFAGECAGADLFAVRPGGAGRCDKIRARADAGARRGVASTVFVGFQRDDDRLAGGLVGAVGDVLEGDEGIGFGVVHRAAAGGDFVDDDFEFADGARFSVVVAGDVDPGAGR